MLHFQNTLYISHFQFLANTFYYQFGPKNKTDEKIDDKERQQRKCQDDNGAVKKNCAIKRYQDKRGKDQTAGDRQEHVISVYPEKQCGHSGFAGYFYGVCRYR